MSNITLGSFVCPKEDIEKENIAIVIYDHKEQGMENFFSIKWMSDGMMSNRYLEDLQSVTPLEFCKIWCKNQMGYAGVKEPTEHPDDVINLNGEEPPLRPINQL